LALKFGVGREFGVRSSEFGVGREFGVRSSEFGVSPFSFGDALLMRFFLPSPELRSRSVSEGETPNSELRTLNSKANPLRMF
jgi:hypothetical protein